MSFTPNIFNDKKEVKTICAEEQEVNDLIEFLKLEYYKYIRYKILYSILEEYINEGNVLNRELKMKVIDIMMSCTVLQCVKTDCKSDNEMSLLGLNNIGNVILSYTERNQLTEALKIKIEEKSSVFKKYLQSLQNASVTSPVPMNRDYVTTHPFTLNFEDDLLINSRETLLSEQRQYINNLLQLRKQLEEIMEVRLHQVPEATELKIKQYHIQNKLNKIKATFTEQKCRLNIFKESSYSLKAYTELIEDIKSQQMELKKEIDNLISLKEKYKQVSCKQFEDLLESYLQYQSSLEKKMKLYNCLTK